MRPAGRVAELWSLAIRLENSDSSRDNDGMNLPFGRSRLKKAIERGLMNGKLREELRELGELTLKSRRDAEDVCWGLQKLNCNSSQLGQQTYALACLFQEVDGRDSDAFELLREHGVPELLRLFDEISTGTSENETDALMFILKILGLYGTVAGTLKIIEAARLPLKPEGYIWNVVLRNFTEGHPEKELLYNSLRNPLPCGFIAVSLLDAANAVLIEGDSMSHPFDSAEGEQRLRDWLSSPDEDHFSYAHSATAALPFISNPERERLLEVAMNHPDTGVQMEAAWVAAKIGRVEGIQRLVNYCRDFRTAQRAKQYLSELGREDAVPPETNDPGFAALAEFARWLSHPNELGRVPDELEIVDHRELRWPPERESKPFWLIKYRVRDATGLEDDQVECGLVGSVTFCLFSYELAQRPPEDAYAVHCVWELEQKGLIEEADVQDDSGEYENLLTQWSGSPPDKSQMRFVAEISPELGYPQRLVGLASAFVNNQQGWIVLDGNRSEWYPQSEQPANANERVVLKIHIGRQLLGFTDGPERKKFLRPTKASRLPEQIIAAYEKLLAKAKTSDDKKRKEAFNGFGAIEKHFDQYVDALQQTSRGSDVRRLVADFAPYWEHASGYSKLGNAAYKCGQFDLAEEFFLKYRNGCTNYERGEEMGLLAEMWCRDGKRNAAQDLLLDCLRRLFEQSKTAEGSDRDLFEKWFQNQRGTFFKLFPADEALLIAQSIPSSTLRPHG
jgi:hypothetical protein